MINCRAEARGRSTGGSRAVDLRGFSRRGAGEGSSEFWCLDAVALCVFGLCQPYGDAPRIPSATLGFWTWLKKQVGETAGRL